MTFLASTITWQNASYLSFPQSAYSVVTVHSISHVFPTFIACVSIVHVSIYICDICIYIIVLHVYIYIYIYVCYIMLYIYIYSISLEPNFIVYLYTWIIRVHHEAPSCWSGLRIASGSAKSFGFSITQQLTWWRKLSQHPTTKNLAELRI